MLGLATLLNAKPQETGQLEQEQHMGGFQGLNRLESELGLPEETTGLAFLVLATPSVAAQ